MSSLVPRYKLGVLLQRKKERGDCGEQLVISITISKNQNSNNKLDVETLAKAFMSVTVHEAVATIYDL